MQRLAAIYARLSDTRKANEPTIDYQVKKCREFLESRGYFIAASAVYIEPEGHRSGRHIAQRPAMQKLQRDLTQYTAIAFYEFARFSRSVSFTNTIIPLADKQKVLIFDALTGERITMETANDYIAANIKSIFAEQESIVASERLKRAYARAKENGWVRHRRAPIGLKVVGSLQHRHFEKTDKLKTVIELFKLIASGMTVFDSATELRKRGYMAQTFGGAPVKFEEYHARMIIRNVEIYRGFIPDPLMDSALRRIKERRGVTGKAKPGKYPPMILGYRLLRCAECGHTFNASYERSRTTAKLLSTYRHTAGYECRNRRRVASWKIEPQVFDVLDAFAKKLLSKPGIIESIAEKHNRQKNVPDPVKRRTELQQKLREAKERLFDNIQLTEEYAELKSRIEKELRELDTQKKEIAGLSPAQIKQFLQSKSDWRELAKLEPLAFNVMLRDLFARIIIDRHNVLHFIPHEQLRLYFAGVRQIGNL